jgi:hypothetical protein
VAGVLARWSALLVSMAVVSASRSLVGAHGRRPAARIAR